MNVTHKLISSHLVSGEMKAGDEIASSDQTARSTRRCTHGEHHSCARSATSVASTRAPATADPMRAGLP